MSVSTTGHPLCQQAVPQWLSGFDSRPGLQMLPWDAMFGIPLLPLVWRHGAWYIGVVGTSLRLSLQ